MKAKTLKDLLKKGDRIAISNITGREASKVAVSSQKYSNNIIGGWALGKGGETVQTLNGDIPVYATFHELMLISPEEKHPNKIIIYSPPQAVYGEIKEVVEHGKNCVETIFIITEHVAVEVTAKIYKIGKEANIDIIGCNTLGMINVKERMRIGAVGGDSPEEAFKTGSVSIFSNSGNMVNTIASYLKASGMGIAYGVSTGKDLLILTPLKEFLKLAEKNKNTKIIMLYIEPGGLYEHEAIKMMNEKRFSKPIVIYIAGKIAEESSITLGHAGSVVEGNYTSATAKMKEFDEYFGIKPFNSDKKYKKTPELKIQLQRGIRINALHDIAKAVHLVVDTLNIGLDFAITKHLNLNPWFVNLKKLTKKLPARLALAPGAIPKTYADQINTLLKNKLGLGLSKQSMKNASRASSNDGVTPRIYGFSLMDLMKKRSFVSSLILYWTGEPPLNEFEERLAEMTLIASLTNGPGTISAQGAKISTSAGNSPNTAIIGTLASMGIVHGGNGKRGVEFLLNIFGNLKINDPYDSKINIKEIASTYANNFKKIKIAAKDASMEYERIPCLGHPVFKNDPVNYDPREQVIYNFIKENNKTNIFLEFYHHLVVELKNTGAMTKVLAVNVDAAIAGVWLGICWRHLRENRMTIERAKNIPFIAFAIGRAAGGAGEYLDHQDFGTRMDMRVPVSECKALSKPRKL